MRLFRLTVSVASFALVLGVGCSDPGSGTSLAADGFGLLDLPLLGDVPALDALNDGAADDGTSTPDATPDLLVPDPTPDLSVPDPTPDPTPDLSVPDPTPDLSVPDPTPDPTPDPGPDPTPDPGPDPGEPDVPTGAPLSSSLEVPPDGEGQLCDTPGSSSECPFLEVCRPKTAEYGQCESCETCGNLGNSCSASNECDILFTCYAGKCVNICPLGTYYCGPIEDCLNIGHPTHGVCKPF